MMGSYVTALALQLSASASGHAPTLASVSFRVM